MVNSRRLAALTALMFVGAVLMSACGLSLRLAPDYSNAEPCDTGRSETRPEPGSGMFVRVDGEYVYGLKEEHVGCYVWEGDQNEPESDDGSMRDIHGDVCEWPDEVATGGSNGPVKAASQSSIGVSFDSDYCRIVLNRLTVS